MKIFSYIIFYFLSISNSIFPVKIDESLIIFLWTADSLLAYLSSTEGNLQGKA